MAIILITMIHITLTRSVLRLKTLLHAKFTKQKEFSIFILCQWPDIPTTQYGAARVTYELTVTRVTSSENNI